MVAAAADIGIEAARRDTEQKVQRARLWWAVQTVTTVGYGDVTPRLTQGRIIAAVLMLTAIGLFIAGSVSPAASFSSAPASLTVNALP